MAAHRQSLRKPKQNLTRKDTMRQPIRKTYQTIGSRYMSFFSFIYRAA